MNTKFDWLTKEILEKDYQELKSFKLISEKYNIYSSNIQRYIKKFGIKTVPKIKYTCHDNLFSSDTEESFYLAGFIAADGCILKNKSKEPNNINITLAEKDLNHLEKIKNLLKFSGPIKKHTRQLSKYNINWKNSLQCQITVYSKQIINDLKKIGIGPRKSLTYEFPNELISHPLVHHFMRGYFDGDGSFFLNKESSCDRICFSLRGTLSFLKTFQEILIKRAEIQSITIPKIQNGIGQLSFKGKDDLMKTINFLYKDAKIYLDRKYNLAKDFI